MSIGTPRDPCFPQKGPQVRIPINAPEEQPTRKLESGYAVVPRMLVAKEKPVEVKVGEVHKLLAPTAWMEDNSEDDFEDENDDDIALYCGPVTRAP